ncbi:YdeI/OmpD-associated family protein [Tessaracoccus caeni]|uniref:YdeI/OmpD-associated family protein n=1 Tax=Tessaracoccus caeni TaxID=3031239 RepID=UPI0023DC809C|nr:YdeI/OmpD-associated family protein [Tessaracoccus caeni]MDF1489697.1 YdeI/OmpD-associated family protein [Tessaracoccus caeni]
MTGRAGGTPERPAVFFADAAEFRTWLKAHHATATELWMGLYKKHVPNRGLTWEDAVIEALCFGWIDSVAQRIDDDATRQRWTPRKKGSTWSKVNVAHVERLIAEGRMTPAGLAAYEARDPAKTGIYSFEQDNHAFTPEHAALLAGNVDAQRWWDAATESYRRVAMHWVAGAKQQATRDRRMAQLIEDSAAGRLIPSQRYGEEPAWVKRNRKELGIGPVDAE